MCNSSNSTLCCEYRFIAVALLATSSACHRKNKSDLKYDKTTYCPTLFCLTPDWHWQKASWTAQYNLALRKYVSPFKSDRRRVCPVIVQILPSVFKLRLGCRMNSRHIWHNGWLRWRERERGGGILRVQLCQFLEIRNSLCHFTSNNKQFTNNFFWTI